MIIAGIGCRAGTAMGVLAGLLQGHAFDAIASHETRKKEMGELARSLGKPLFLHRSLSGIETATHSARIFAIYGTGSLAEAAALASLAPGGRLIQTRVTSNDGRATLALAQGEPR